MKPTITVIIPVYEGAHVVPEALASAFEQTLPPNEVIVIDDCSTDRTALELAVEPWLSEGRIRLLQTARNAGPATARNVGILQATGDFVAFLDADDRFERDHLQAAMDAFGRWPDTLMTFADAFVRRERVVLAGTKNDRWKPIPELVTVDHLLEGNCVSTLTVVVRRSALHQVGPFDETPIFYGIEDYDMWLRLAEIGAVRYIDRPLCTYSKIVGSVSDDPERLFEGVTAVFEKLERRIGDRYPQALASTQRRRREMQVDLAYNHCSKGNYAAARRAACTAIAGNPVAWPPYKMLLKALLRR